MRRLFARPFLTALCLTGFLALNVSAQQAPVGPPPIPQNDSPKSNKPDDGMKAQPNPASGSSVDVNSYKVGPGDILMIKVWGEERFTGPVTVMQNGSFTMPLVGDIPAGDVTPRDIETAVAKALTKYVVKPLVTITVQSVESKKYYITGMIARQGEYPLAVPTTILDAILKAGGPQDFANEKKIYVLRGSSKLMFNYKEVKNGKHMEQNINLQPNDRIFIP